MGSRDSSDEQAIRAVLENIAATFSRLDLAAWLENFHSPRMVVTPDACLSPGSAADAEILMGPLVSSLRARGFDRTSIDSCSVRFLTPTSAVASVVFSRYASGELLERLGGTYVLQKRDGRWGVLLVAVHGPESLFASD